MLPRVQWYAVGVWRGSVTRPMAEDSRFDLLTVFIY